MSRSTLIVITPPRPRMIWTRETLIAEYVRTLIGLLSRENVPGVNTDLRERIERGLNHLPLRP